MQNQTPAPNARPKLTIMYFTKIALEQLKGKIPVILLILALLALPAAAVNAYSSGNLLSEVSRLYTRYDLTSPKALKASCSRFRTPEFFLLCGYSPLVYLPAAYLRGNYSGRSLCLRSG